MHNCEKMRHYHLSINSEVDTIFVSRSWKAKNRVHRRAIWRKQHTRFQILFPLPHQKLSKIKKNPQKIKENPFHLLSGCLIASCVFVFEKQIKVIPLTFVWRINGTVSCLLVWSDGILAPSLPLCSNLSSCFYQKATPEFFRKVFVI